MKPLSTFFGSQVEIVAQMSEAHIELTEEQMEMLAGGDEGEEPQDPGDGSDEGAG